MIFDVTDRGPIVEAFGPLDENNAPIGAEWCGGQFVDGVVEVPFRFAPSPVPAPAGTYLIRDDEGYFGICTAAFFSPDFERVEPPVESERLVSRIATAKVASYDDVDWEAVRELVERELEDAGGPAAGEGTGGTPPRH